MGIKKLIQLIATFLLGVSAGWLMKQRGDPSTQGDESVEVRSSDRSRNRVQRFEKQSGEEFLSKALQLAESPLEGLMADLSSEDLWGIVDQLDSSPEIWDSESSEFKALEKALVELGERDGEVAWKRVMEIESSRIRKKHSALVLLGISKSNRDLALQLYQENQSGMGFGWGSKAVANFMEDFANDGVEQFLSVYRNLPKTSDAQFGMRLDFPDGFDFVPLIQEMRSIEESIPRGGGGALRPSLGIQNLVGSWAAQDADAALSSVLDQARDNRGRGSSYAVVEVLDAQIRQLGEPGAMEWFSQWAQRDSSLGEPAVITQLSSSFIGEPEIAEGIANALPQREVRENLLLNSAMIGLSRHPELSIRYLEMVPEGPERMGLLNRFVEQVSPDQHSPYRRFVNDSTFSVLAEGFRTWGVSEQEISSIRNQLFASDSTPSNE